MRIKKGINITRESWGVLKSDPELLIFPVCSVLATAAIALIFILVPLLLPEGKTYAQNFVSETHASEMTFKIIGYSLLFVVYFTLWAITIFFNTALVGCASMRFSGKDPTVMDGFRIAFSRMPQILGWALLASSVGMILSVIEERLNFLGKVIISIIGVAWTVATYFVVPQLAVEGIGPVSAVQNSVTLLKKNWGEALTGNFVINIIPGFLSVILTFVAILGCLAAMAKGSVVLAVSIGGMLLLVLMCISIVSSALRQIFLAGLYRYATTGDVPHGFSEITMQQALTSSSSHQHA